MAVVHCPNCGLEFDEPDYIYYSSNESYRAALARFEHEMKEHRQHCESERETLTCEECGRTWEVSKAEIIAKTFSFVLCPDCAREA